MSLTGLLFLAAFIAMMALALFRHPIHGLYGYVALFYLHPPDRWWASGLPDLRWTLTASVVTLLATLRLRSDPSRPSWLSETPAKLLLAFTAWLWIQSFWALLPEAHFFFATLYLKYIVLFYLIFRLVDQPERVRGFLTVHFLGCAYLGWLAYNASFSGRLEGVGGPGIDEANALGMQLVTGILSGAMLILDYKGWRRWLLVAAMPLVINGLVLTQSRSAFLGLAVGCVVLWYLKPGGRRRIFYAFAALALVLGGMLAHELFWQRMTTVVTAVESIEKIDQSAASRLAVFEAQVKMAKAYPMGAGHRGTLALSNRYLADEHLTYLADGSGQRGRSSHSTFMSVVVEQGLPGVAIFGGLGLWFIAAILRMRRLARAATDEFTSIMGAGVAAALMAVVVSGIFVDYVKAEVQIWCAALLSVVLWHARRQPPTEDDVNDNSPGIPGRRMTCGSLLAAGLAAAVCASLSPPASAYQFEPTEAEFNAWPQYCRARYVTTTIGQSSIFAQRLDRSAQATAEGAIGAQTFLHVHHYCAGLLHLARARLEPDAKKRRFELDEARAEIMYSLRNDPGNGPLQSTMVVNLAVIERERGDSPAARQLLENAIRLAPSDPKPYLGLAIVLRSDKKLAEARAILEQGLAAAGTEALELHYNLGLICVELEDFECAVRHARAAYAQGYPFPGLRNRLADRGLWQE